MSGSIGAIAIDPKNPERLFLGIGYRPSSDGSNTVKRLDWVSHIYITGDGGESWRSVRVFEEPAKVTRIKVSESGEVYLASSRGLYVSPDGEHG